MDKNISKIEKIIIASLACVIGGILVCLAFNITPKAVVFMLILLCIIELILIFRKGHIHLSDWLIIFLVVIPLHNFKIGNATFFLRFTEIIFIPLFIWWIVYCKLTNSPQQKKKFPIEFTAMVFFFLFSFISSIAKSLIPAVSIVRTVLLSYIVFVSYIFVNTINTPEKVSRFVKTLMIISAVTGVIALIQSFFPSFSLGTLDYFATIGGVNIYRAEVGWENPGYYSLYLVGILPVTVSCFVSNRFPRQKLFLLWCLIFQTIGLIASGTRGGVMAFFASVLFLLWMYGRKTIAIIVMVLIFVTIFLLYLNMDYIYENHFYIAMYVFRIGNLDWVKQDPKLILGHRIEAWTVYWRMFVDNPLLGLGPFVARERYLEYLGNDIPNYNYKVAPHSEYLSMLAERGFLGFISFISFIVLLMKRCLRYTHNNHESKESALLFGFMASVVGFLVFSLSGASIYDVTFWVNVGLMIAITYLPVVNISQKMPKSIHVEND